MGIRYAQVHFSVRIGENTQSANLFHEIIGCGLTIALGDAEEDEEPGSDFSSDISIDGNFRPAYALNHSCHSKNPFASNLVKMNRHP